MHLLKASVVYRFFDRLLENIYTSAKQSMCLSLLVACYLFFARLFSASLFGRTWQRIDSGIRHLPQNSFFVRRFVRLREPPTSPGMFASICRTMFGGICRVYRASALLPFLGDRKLLHPVFWCVLTVFATPFLPTMLVLGLVLVCVCTLILSKAKAGDRSLAASSVNRPIAFFALLYVLSTITALGRGGSIEITAIILAFTLFSLVLITAITTREQLNYLLFFLLAGGLLVSLLGISQYFFGILLVDSTWVDDEMFDIARRAYATFENPNVFGAYFLLVIPFALAAVFAVKEKMLRIIALAVLAVMALVLGLTFSRGAYLGIVIAVAVFLVLLDRRMIFLGMFALIAAYFILPDAILTRFLSIGNMEDTSTAYRVSIWLATLDMIGDHLILGIGPGLGTWQMTYPLYAFAAAVAHHSHMLFLQILTELGLVGFFLFLVIVYQFYKNGFVAFLQGTKEARYWSMASIAAMTGFLVMGFTDYPLFNYRLRFLFWVLIAIGVLNQTLKEEKALPQEVGA